MRSGLLIACLLLPTLARAGEDEKRRSEQHYLSGMIYFQKKDYAKAREEWLLAEQFDPTDGDAQAGLARIDRLIGPAGPVKSAKAPTASTDAMRRSHQRYLSGMIYYQKGDFGKARDEWKRALKLYPANGDAQAGLEQLDHPLVDSAGAAPGSGPVAPDPPPGPLPGWKDVPPPPFGLPTARDFPIGRGGGKGLGTLDADPSK